MKADVHTNGDTSQHDPFYATCIECHDPHDNQSNWLGGTNVKMVGLRDYDQPGLEAFIDTPNSGRQWVVLESLGPGVGEPTLHSPADSDEDDNGVYDGVCEVCHTQTSHHRNDADDFGHYTGTTCSSCHPHDERFLPVGGDCDSCHGQPPDGDIAPNRAGSHAAHMSAQNGPGIASCDTCHAVPGSGAVHMNGQASFASGPDTNGDGDISLTETDVCDSCHGIDGPFDGVEDPTFGAKSNWADGVYDGDNLAAGKEAWCAGCHDLGSSTVHGVTAPPVAGDDATWGYFATGHGANNLVTCTRCHDPSEVHVDGIEDSYVAALDNYQVAFRLKSVNGGPPLVVPRFGSQSQNPYYDPPYWELCFSCHDRYALLGGPDAPAGPYHFDEIATNFRSDAVVIIPDGLGTDIAQYSQSGAKDVNSHYTHLTAPPHYYDSDRDEVNESYDTCVACHNVHGSTSPAMIRDGKLLGKEPGLNFKHVRYDRHNPSQGGCPDPIIMTSFGVFPFESVGGVMRANSGPAVNGVCSFCHGGGANTDDPEYIINCYGPDFVDYYRTFISIDPPPGG
jgi:hypothetical protein